MATSPEHRKAQRRLAKEIKSGTFKPSSIGKKAREAAGNLKQRLVDQIQDLKRDAFGNRIKWNEDRSRKYVQVSPETGDDRTIEELRNILAGILQWNDDGQPDDWHGLVDLTGGEYESAFYYH